MNKDRVEGKIEDIKGRVKRQVGEWVGDDKAQSEGAAQQVKGKIQNAWGKAKDAGRDVLEQGKDAPINEKKKDDHAA